MTQNLVIDLFDNWERVWNGRQLNLVADCVAPIYIRNEEAGTRQVTPEQYEQELAGLQKDRPDVKIKVYDHDLTSEGAWFRFSINWTDVATGEARQRSGFQQYRVESGKLAETWVAFLGNGATWTDEPQDRWTAKKAK